MKREKAWKSRTLLNEITMSDGFRLTFWIYEWNDDVALRLKHRYCVRIRKLNPNGFPLLTEQIGVRVDNWNAFLDIVNRLKPTIPKTLQRVLTVLEQVYKKGRTYDEAVEIAANKLKLHQKDIRHRCTIDLGLKTSQLRKLLNNKEKLTKLVIAKFPDYEDTIREALS